MNKTKFRSITLAALMLAFALVLSFAISSLTSFRKVSAADYRPATIFSAGTGGSVGVSDKEESETKFIKFTFNDEGSIYFRRDLALKWYEAASADDENTENPENPEDTENETDPEETQTPDVPEATENDEDTESDAIPDEDEDENEDADTETDAETQAPKLVNPGAARYFSLEFQFLKLNFSEFSLVFESAEENVSKDSTSKNAIKFFNEDGKTTATVQNASEQDLDDKTEWSNQPVDVNLTGDVKVTFDEKDCTIGEFAVYINGTFIGKLTNVGGNYMEYLSSSSSTPRIPLTFKLDKISGDNVDFNLLVKSLNGQTFEVNDEGRVVDNASPVLVINESIYAYKLGKRWSLTYKAIDVCDDSVTVSRKYAMLTSEDGVFKKPVSDDYKSLTTSTYFMPTSDDGSLEQYVSIYFSLDDGTLLSDEEKEERYVYLTWYAVDGAVSTQGEGDEAFDYIKVNREEGGPKYIGLTADSATKSNIKDTNADDEIILDVLKDEYQNAINEVSKDLSAGDGSYFYLPSLRSLIKSDYADYRNLRFSIYYRKQSDEVGSTASTAASLSYNSLRFQITEEGKYIFKVLASDSSSKVMQYYYEGKLQDVTANNIWEIDEIPFFSFEVGYNGAEIEDPGSQSLGYSEQSYTFSSFDIIALKGYETNYTLYRLDLDKVPDNVFVPGYNTLAENTKDYFDKLLPYMAEIKVYNDNVTEDDKDRWNDTDNAYHWNPDNALSFTPQEPAYYFLKLVVTESRMPGKEAVNYQVVDVRNKIDPLPTPSEWLENNIVSVVLFSISALLAIIIVVLFVVKPSEKQVDEVDLDSLKGKKKK